MPAGDSPGSWKGKTNRADIYMRNRYYVPGVEDIAPAPVIAPGSIDEARNLLLGGGDWRYTGAYPEGAGTYQYNYDPVTGQYTYNTPGVNERGQPYGAYGADYYENMPIPRPQYVAGGPSGGSTAYYTGRRGETNQTLYAKAVNKRGLMPGYHGAFMGELKAYQSGDKTWDQLSPWVRMLILQGQHHFGQTPSGPHNPPPTVPPHTPPGTGGGGTTGVGGPMVTWRP